MRRWAHAAASKPSAPPASDNRRFSVNNWRTMRHRPAPSASRIPISRERAAERAIRRFARLAQAISRIIPVRPNRIFSVPEPFQKLQRRSEVPCAAGFTSSLWDVLRRPAGEGPIQSSIACWNSGASWTCAWVAEMPGFRRPSTHGWLLAKTPAWGTHRSGSCARSTPKNSGGMTPITVYGSPDRRTVVPRGAGLLPIRRLQNA